MAHNRFLQAKAAKLGHVTTREYEVELQSEQQYVTELYTPARR